MTSARSDAVAAIRPHSRCDVVAGAVVAAVGAGAGADALSTDA